MTSKENVVRADDRTYTREEVNALIIEALRSQDKTPIHIHHCTEGHDWPCTSPYCEDVSSVPRACATHGGTPPIVKGLEPWRGKAV